MNASQLNPAPAGREHDADGRLIGLVHDSTPALQAPDVNPWLVAVDGSDNALRAVTHAARQAGAMHACALHIIQVQPWLSKEAAEAELARRGLDATARARSLLDAQGIPWRLHVALGDPAECILERAVQLRVTGIIIGSRGLSTVAGLLFGSVAYKIMHLSRLPVLVVP